MLMYQTQTGDVKVFSSIPSVMSGPSVVSNPASGLNGESVSGNGETENRLDTAMSALKWLAIGGGVLFLLIAVKGARA